MILHLIKKIESLEIPFWYPKNRMPDGDEPRSIDEAGIIMSTISISKRNLWYKSCYINKLPRQ